jgi:uncharacterized protein (TIGR03067 family)
MVPRLASAFLVAALALAAGRPAEAGSKKDLAALQGSWALVSVERDGEVQEFTERPFRWVIKGAGVRYGGQPLAELALDPLTTPKNIELTFLKPKRVYEGVYTLDGDTLKICVNRQTEGVKDRPVGFQTKGKADLRLLVFKRDKAGAGERLAELPGFVGIQIMKTEKELIIAGVLDGGAAKSAGVKKDDVLLKVGASEAKELRAVVEMVRETRPGSELTLRIRRDGKERDFTLKVGVMPFFLLD